MTEKLKIKRIPTTKDTCSRCCFLKYEDECDLHQNECRTLFSGISYYLEYVLPEGFESMNSAPKNSTFFTAVDSNGEIMENIHYACDTSGEYQPPFEGFFDKNHVEVLELVGWKNE